MKTLNLSLSLLFAVAMIQAQDYQISFTGSGQSTTVDSIHVKNLTQGTTLTLNGDDVLYLVINVGINSMNDNQNNLKIYPNPMMESTFVEFVSSNAGQVCIEIYNEMGVLTTKQSRWVQQGSQRFEISGLKEGIHTVNVSSADWKCATKLISLGNNQGNISINHQSTSAGSVHENVLKNTKALVQMQYNDGETILFKGFAENHARVLTLLPTQSQNVNFDFIPCIDGDGNSYAVVTIGNQTWMAENLNYPTSYSWCYDNDPANCDTYGRLYDWWDAGLGCPSGWDLPSDEEWKELEGEVDSQFGYPDPEWDDAGYRGLDAGLNLKSTSGWNSGLNGTDFYGFSALPGGRRNQSGSFFSQGLDGDWWSSTLTSNNYATHRVLNYNHDLSSRNSNVIYRGASVRCLRD